MASSFRKILSALAVLMVFCSPRVLASDSLGELFQGQLANLAFKPSNRSPYLGGGNLYHCCLLAVNDSLLIEHGNISFKPGQTILHGTFDSFLSHQFPCDTTYNGSSSSLDEPQVTVTYDWCHNNCPGWQLADNSDLGEWVRPLVSYITPSVVFVLSIPRRRRIKVPASFIPQKLASFSGGLALIYKVPAASLVITLDTILWLVIVFSLSGPLLLSGIYEALLDNRILRFLESRVAINNLSVRERTHLLLIVLLGNLDYHPAWKDSQALVKVLPNCNVRHRFRSIASTLSSSAKIDHTTTVDSVVCNKTSSSSSSSGGISAQDGKQPTQHKMLVRSEIYSPGTQSYIDMMKLKLKSMLACQTSFGTAVGAALVFYMGSFIYTLVESEDKIGDSWTAHNIGFGMFWMVVPRVAIVSSLLLAGNNPNIWQGIAAISPPERTSVASPTRSSMDAQTVTVSNKEGIQQSNKPWWKVPLMLLDRRTPLQMFDSMYDSKYKPAWLWNRGICKATWVARYVNEYPRLTKIEDEVLRMGFEGGVLYTTAPALILLVVPTFLAGLISYTTPAVGLSCRSMTMLIYACSQVWLIMLWLCDWVFWQRDHLGKVKLTASQDDQPPWANILWYIGFAIGILAAVFAGVFGTVFFLLGLYRNCLCLIPIQYWSNRHVTQTTTSLDNVNRYNFHMAKAFWLQCGVSVTVFLVAVTYIGWWYQSHLRAQFLHLVDQIDNVNEDQMREAEDTIDVEDFVA